MTRRHPLEAVLLDTAVGRFPPEDGSVQIFGSPPGLCDAVVAFTGFNVIAADVDAARVLERLPDSDAGAPMKPEFLSWLGNELRTTPGLCDLVLVAEDPPEFDAPDLVLRDDLSNHPRVGRALRYRTDVKVYGDRDNRGVLILGRGLANRMEVSFEIHPAHRGKGLGLTLAAVARSLAPPNEPLFAQVSPGNVASVRVLLAAGYRPICSEVLFLRP